MKVFDAAISGVPAKSGIVFDGFARQITEAKIYLNRLKKLGRAIDAVILVNISAKETIKRLSKRAECESCHKILILDNKNKIGGQCPHCRGKIVKRSDDEPAAIAKRLRLYKKRTLPVIRYFKNKNLLITINGEQSIQKVHRDIIAALKKRKLAK
jgi:adenylate kinase